MVTNYTLAELFKSLYPDLTVKNVAPLDVSMLKKRMGITVTLDNGDVMLYFPKEIPVNGQKDDRT